MHERSWGAYQVHDPPEHAALQAGPEAATGTLDTVGCMHICCRDPRTVILGLWHTSWCSVPVSLQVHSRGPSQGEQQVLPADVATASILQ